MSDRGYIMISYNWDHQRIVKKLWYRLWKEGYRVWIDINPEDGMKHDIYSDMANAVKDAEVVLCCLSRAYQNSENCKRESNSASLYGKTRIPLLLEDYKLEDWVVALFSGILYIKFSNEEQFEEKFKELLQRLKQFPNLNPQKNNPTPAHVPPPDDLPTSGNPPPPETDTNNSDQLIPRIGLSQQDFNFLKLIVSEYFDERKLFGMLMVLYKDSVKEHRLLKVESTLDLLNALDESDELNVKNLTILYDTINLTEQYRLQREIQERFPSFPNVKGKEITRFTSYRQRIVRFGLGLVERDVTTIDGLFNSTPKKYSDSWSMIRHLEYKQIITETGLNDLILNLERLGLKQAVLELKKP